MYQQVSLLPAPKLNRHRKPKLDMELFAANRCLLSFNSTYAALCCCSELNTVLTRIERS